MLQVVNWYIHLRVNIKVLLLDVMSITMPSRATKRKQMTGLGAARSTAAKLQRSEQAPIQRLTSSEFIATGLEDLELELQQLGAACADLTASLHATPNQTTSDICGSPSSGPGTLPTRCAFVTPRQRDELSITPETLLQLSLRSNIGKVSSTSLNGAMSTKCVAEFSRDEVAIALITKFQRVSTSCR